MVDEAFHRAVAWDLPHDPSVVRDALGQGRQLLADHGAAAPPMRDWSELSSYLDDLYEGRIQIGDSDQSVELAAAALAAEPPLVGVAPAFAVAADWEGPAREMLTRTAEGSRHWGWHGIALPLARVLLRADATWAARALSDLALGVVSMATDRLPQGFPTWYLDEAVVGFREVAREAERQHEEASDKLAWAIRRACRAPDSPIRPVVAALWWALGSPWHATAVASDGLVPTLRQTTAIVDALLFSLGTDSLLGAVGAQLWAVPEPLPGALRRRLGVALATEEYERVEEPFREHGVSPSRLFASALVDRFARRVDPDAPEVVARLADIVGESAPRAAIRLRSLALLLRDEPGGWTELAERAAALVAEENWLATENPYDRAVDVPLYHLSGGPDERLAALERHRAAALSYPLLVERALAAREADDPRGDRHELLAETRGMRLVAQLPGLPPLFTRAYSTLRDNDLDPGATRRDWADAAAAAEELRRLRPRLELVCGQDRPTGSLHDFGAALA
jgi:hypothetical protein